MKNLLLALCFGCVLFSAKTSAAQSTNTLTLTTYNIHSAIPDGKNNSNYWPRIEDLNNVADVLTTAGADIIALQEVRNMWSSPRTAPPGRYPLNFSLYLSALLDMDYVFGSGLQFVPQGFHDEGQGARYRENRNYLEWGNWLQWTNNGAPQGNYGNAILSRLPMVTPPEILKLPRGTDAEATRLGDEPRNALRIELKEPVGSLGRVVVYCTHFQHNNPKTRLMQIRHLLDRASQDLAPDNARGTTVTVFLMGDFNHFPQPAPDEFLDAVADAGYHDLAKQYAKARGEEPAGTIKDHRYGRRIDYIFSSRQVNISNVTVLESDVSDHLPVTVTLEY